jgi:hypothetical protein
MHDKTISCVAKAEALIAEGDADSVRYACLELRMGIEHLFYDLIPLYADGRIKGDGEELKGTGVVVWEELKGRIRKN